MAFFDEAEARAAAELRKAWLMRERDVTSEVSAQVSNQNLAEGDAALVQGTGSAELILSKPWANLAAKADVRVWVANASEEELREMAEFALGDGPRDPALDTLQQHLLIAVNETEGSVRRVMAAQMQNERAAIQRQRETLKGIL